MLSRIVVGQTLRLPSLTHSAPHPPGSTSRQAKRLALQSSVHPILPKFAKLGKQPVSAYVIFGFNSSIGFPKGRICRGGPWEFFR